MHKSGYMPRLIDSELELRLRAFGAVLLEGPKFCGKTTSAEHIAASTLYMQDEDRSADYLNGVYYFIRSFLQSSLNVF